MTILDDTPSVRTVIIQHLIKRLGYLIILSHVAHLIVNHCHRV